MKNVAHTILAQLGGNKFLAMTGAKNLVAGDNYLMFSLPRAKDGNNKVRISLDATDTYTVDAFRIRGIDCTPKASVGNVYNDSLQAVFTAITGLYTRL